MTPTTFLLIWTCCALFNILKLVQSFPPQWHKDYAILYFPATVFAPYFTVGALIVLFIFKKWK